MRLVLSLYNGRAFSFSIPVCIRDLDEERAELAKAVILDYFERGEREELLSLAQKFSQMIEPVEWGGKPKTAKIPSNENDSPIPSYASSRQAVTVCFKPRFLM